ncbi:putative Ig domain-containing protein [Leptospira vanthielii]|uniref:DUF4215 domain-containing protein n=1 Tax=Leptospira vanthielii TaxID=293085 RepID=A0ABY2NSN4_9LEPT|nr:putative Ig domain-containing protein [Leptospira vanthielii]TGM60360.1 DUF4215 domain-containing protein [Leptospira vanthielii]
MNHFVLKIFVFSLFPLIGFLGCDLTSGKEDAKFTPAELITLVVASNPGNSSSPPSSLSYTGSPYVFFRNTAISAKVPSVTGKVESCKSNLTFPVGINLGNTCTISGTPTANQAATNYIITAENSFGSTSAAISIQVKDATCGNGVIEGNEVCDDNNTINGDGCNNACSGA